MKTIIILLLSHIPFWQDKPKDLLKLDFIKDHPIKIDGECSFFTYDTTAIGERKDILVVDGHKLAFVQNNKKYIYFYYHKRVLKPNGYTDYFSGEKYKIKLDVVRVKEISRSSTEYEGTLKLTYGKMSRTIAIHGLNEESIFHK